MTPEEKELGFPKSSLATHTEARITKKVKVKKDEKLTITGQYPPCPSCKGKMNKAAQENGGAVEYQWRENGATQIWKATLKRKK